MTKFKEFKNNIENQLNTRIKAIQIDNAGEYKSHDFRKFLAQNGITHRLACPYTHEHVGIGERKHRHIVDMGLVLLHNSDLPLKFWPYALSLSSIHYTPYQLLI